MKGLVLLLGCISLFGCAPGPAVQNNSDVTPVVTGVPGVSTVCGAIADSKTFDTALRAYDIAQTSVDALVDFKVIKPGTPTANKIADANDKVLAGFALAEAARGACRATDYFAALAQAQAAIVQIQALIPKRSTP